MSSKKRKSSGKRPSHRKGLSGNPERRAHQLGMTDDRPGMLALARQMAGGADPAPWWADSHEQILARARSLTWPSPSGDIEELTCEVVGDEFFDRLQKQHDGFHMTGWLRALIETAGKAARDAVTDGSADWPQLWALLHGLTLITPSETGNETGGKLRELFPDILDPLDVARAEAEKTAVILTERGMPESTVSTRGAQAAGEPLLARDAYGSRLLLTLPFGYPDGDDVPVDHWYAWDIDMCWNDMALSAGAFGSPADALKEWSDAVGPAAAASALTPCPKDTIPALLYPLLQTGPVADMLDGGEPRPLIREYFRLRRRAREIAVMPDDGARKVFEADRMVDEFGTWYRTRHGDTPDTVHVAAEIIADHWGPVRSPDERMFLACSPHRISQTAVLIRDQYFADHANPALLLLPEWTQWCIDRTGLTGPAAERALQEATAETGHLVDDARRKPARRDDTEPFRRQE